MIALAYTRRELWPQAEIFRALCRKRATAADPLPEWVPLVETQLADRLGTVEVAQIEIVVKPADAHARITVSSFAPDESHVRARLERRLAQVLGREPLR